MTQTTTPSKIDQRQETFLDFDSKIFFPSYQAPSPKTKLGNIEKLGISLRSLRFQRSDSFFPTLSTAQKPELQFGDRRNGCCAAKFSKLDACCHSLVWLRAAATRKKRAEVQYLAMSLRRPNQRSYSELNPPPPHSRTVMRRTIWQGIYSSPSCTYLDLRSQISNIHSATTPTRLCTSNHISRWHTGTLATSFRFLLLRDIVRRRAVSNSLERLMHGKWLLTNPMAVDRQPVLKYLIFHAA